MPNLREFADSEGPTTQSDGFVVPCRGSDPRVRHFPGSRTVLNSPAHTLTSVRFPPATTSTNDLPHRHDRHRCSTKARSLRRRREDAVLAAPGWPPQAGRGEPWTRTQARTEHRRWRRSQRRDIWAELLAAAGEAQSRRTFHDAVYRRTLSVSQHGLGRTTRDEGGIVGKHEEPSANPSQGKPPPGNSDGQVPPPPPSDGKHKK